jgi:hypothetical protein
MVRRHRAFMVKAWGFGTMGAAVQRPRFRMGVATSPYIEVAMGAMGVAARDRFFWEVEGLQQVAPTTGFLRSKLTVYISRYTSNATNAQGGYLASPSSAVAATRSTWGDVKINPEWQTIQIRGCFNNASAGQLIQSIGSTYETYEPYRGETV